MTQLTEVERLKQEIALLETKKLLEQNLPHLYGDKFYKWQREFFESTNRLNFLTAANQIGKSSVSIRKCINWAIDKSLWPRLFGVGKKPRVFWYLYPSKAIVNQEVLEKWIPEFLPRGEFERHPEFGWQIFKQNTDIAGIRFNSGVTVYFKTYEQNPQNLQAGTVWAIFTDEELPSKLFDELMFRLSATNGYFHQVFTATLGQKFWKDIIEGPKMPDSAKWQISLYDCMVYEDGSKTAWTKARIQERINMCSTQAEVDRRIFGKFVKAEGQRFPTFQEEFHVIKPKPVPKEWVWYVGVDPGGGGTSHPSAIAFIAVNPEMTQGWIVKTWRGDKIVTTASDVLRKYSEMVQDLGITPVLKSYDFSAKDFGTIADRMGVAFAKADKRREAGDEMLNNLWRNNALLIFDTDENRKLVDEIFSASHDDAKQTAEDDLIDAVRYGIMPTPWDYPKMQKNPLFPVPEKKIATGGVDVLLREGKLNLDELREARGAIFGEDDAYREYYDVFDL